MTDNAPKYLVEIVGWDGAKVRSFSGESSIRKLELDPDLFQVTETPDAVPPSLTLSFRPEIKAVLLALGGNASALTVDTLTVRTIIAKGTGNTPDPNVPDLSIVTKGGNVGSYDEVFRVVAGNYQIIDIRPSISWFAGTAVHRQELHAGWNVDDLQSALEQYNLVPVV